MKPRTWKPSKLNSREESALWQSHRPRPDICNICGKPAGPDVIIEQRPTGIMFKLQDWPYCPGCWEIQQGLCEEPLDIEAIVEILNKGLECKAGLKYGIQ
jgi:hypothetical protein